MFRFTSAIRQSLFYTFRVRFIEIINVGKITK